MRNTLVLVTFLGFRDLLMSGQKKKRPISIETTEEAASIAVPAVHGEEKSNSAGAILIPKRQKPTLGSGKRLNLGALQRSLMLPSQPEGMDSTALLQASENWGSCGKPGAKTLHCVKRPWVL